MSRNDAFYLEEYKSLRQEIVTKLKDRLEFSRWGLIGLAALYSYILSNPGKPVLFWIPVWLSLVMIGHLNEEHRIVHKEGDYIREQLEPWAKSGDRIPEGWEMYWAYTNNPPPWSVFWRRWPRKIWDWSPVPLWVSVLVLTLVIAIVDSASGWLFELTQSLRRCSFLAMLSPGLERRVDVSGPDQDLFRPKLTLGELDR